MDSQMKSKYFLFILLTFAFSCKHFEQDIVLYEYADGVNDPFNKLPVKPLVGFSELSKFKFNKAYSAIWVEYLGGTHVRKKNIVDCHIKVEGNEVMEISGIVCDMPNHNSHLQVYVYIADRLIPIKSQLPSPSKMKKLNDPNFDKCSFKDKIDISQIPKGKYTLQFIVTTKFGEYYRLNLISDPIEHLCERKLQIEII